MIPSTVARGSSRSEPWPGRDGVERRVERRAGGAGCRGRRHVAVGRRDDDRRPLHDVVAGEQHALLDQQPAQVVRGVAGRVHARSVKSGPVSSKPSPTARSGSKPSRASNPSTSAPVRAASAAAPGAWSGWVWVTTIQRMRPAPSAARASMWAVVVGAGVDHGELVGAHQVAVGARPRHHARVGGGDPDHHGPTAPPAGRARGRSRSPARDGAVTAPLGAAVGADGADDRPDLGRRQRAPGDESGAAATASS